jgi:hypothetical protein
LRSLHPCEWVRLLNPANGKAGNKVQNNRRTI